MGTGIAVVGREGASLGVPLQDCVHSGSYLGEMTQALKGTVWDSGCKSWYQTAEGINFAIWPKSTWRYWLATRKVNEADYRFVKCAGQSNQDTARVPGGQAMAQTAAR